MSQNFSMPQPKIAIRVLVRDKDGVPKFDDLSKIGEFRHLLSEEDIIKLEKKHGQKFHLNDSGT